MKFWTDAELKEKNSEEIIAYKSLLLHEADAQFDTNNIKSELSKLDEVINSKFNNYFSVGTREVETALQVQNSDIRFLNGIMDKIRVVMEDRKQLDRIKGEENQKEAMKNVLKNITYSISQIVGILGSSQVIEIVGHERAAKMVGMENANQRVTTGNSRNRDLDLDLV